MKVLTTTNMVATYVTQCISLFGEADGVKTIGGFVNRVQALCEKYFPNDPEEEEAKSPALKFKGDILEIFAEIFFDIYSADPAVGLKNYTSVPLEEDFGVDGLGTNVNGDKCAVQMKYKQNPFTKIKYDEISKTFSAGRLIHRLDLNEDNTIIVFTTGGDMTNACRTVFGNKIRLIDRNIIAGFVDNNHNFWSMAEDVIVNTLEALDRVPSV